jgi:ADP-ribosylglycohydrolase
MGRAEALRSLQGLSVGDAYGQARLMRFYRREPGVLDGSWPWTDDTHMALSIVEVLEAHARIDQDALASAFARRFGEEPTRGYAGGAVELLLQIGEGERWDEVAPSLFGGQGSFGNGGAMRAAPLGAWFGGRPELAAEEGERSAQITHAHEEGRAGAVAVAVAAALLAGPSPPAGDDLLRAVAAALPDCHTRAGIEAATRFGASQLDEAAMRLGTGRQVSSQDTVPFCLWVVARYGASFELAVKLACGPPGDCDTVGAIVGGLVVLTDPAVPAEWLRLREPLPPGFEA